MSMEMAYAIEKVATALWSLGTGDAATTMGAIEFHAATIKESSETISSSLNSIAIALTEIAIAIRECDFHD